MWQWEGSRRGSPDTEQFTHRFVLNTTSTNPPNSSDVADPDQVPQSTWEPQSGWIRIQVNNFDLYFKKIIFLIFLSFLKYFFMGKGSGSG